MDKKRKAVETLGVAMLFGGLIIIIGTAGGSDLELLSFKDIFIRSSIGVALMGVGYFMAKLATGGGLYND